MVKPNAASFATFKLPQKDMKLRDRDPAMAALVDEEISRQKKGNRGFWVWTKC